MKLYPLLLLNEPILSLGPSNLAFRRKFEQLLIAHVISKESDAIRIMPLSIMNISELQDVQQSVLDRDQTIFNLLQMHFTSTDLKKIKTTFEAATPLHFVINNNISNKKRISDRVRLFKWLGFNKHK